MKLFFVALVTFALAQGVFAEERSPFTDIDYSALPSVIVEVNNENYYLLAINGVRRAQIFAQCEAVFGADCSCMFAEKFTETMSALGYEIGNTVNLELYYMPNHSVFALDAHPVTEDNAIDLSINRSLRNEACF